MDENLAMIKKDVEAVLKCSQGLQEVSIYELFMNWHKNKQRLIKDFNHGQLIYELPDTVTFELSDCAKTDKLNHFINTCHSAGYPELSNFLEAEREGFFSNSCVKDYGSISKGSKLVKCFKHFIEDKDTLNDLQMQASTIIQENKIEGKMCFSVHPLDYLSISENTHNWRSCHSLDGDYRAGNLNYMADDCTIVCYLKSEAPAVLPNFPAELPWNNKKWRVLLYISNNEEMAFLGKPYPFETKAGLEIIRNEYLNKQNWYNGWKDISWSDWTDYTISSVEVNKVKMDFDQPYIPIHKGLIGLNALVQDGKNTRQFNDVLHSSTYKPYYSYATTSNWWTDGSKYCIPNVYDTHFKIGQSVNCIHCGKQEIMPSGNDTMMCYDCEAKYGTAENDMFSYCYWCDSRISIDDGIYINGVFCCPDCFYEHGAFCDDCGDAYMLKQLTPIKDSNNNTVKYYCRHCINSPRFDT